MRLTWTAVAAVFVLMTVGNVVSATSSGLACPDWPLCHGRLIPPLVPGVLIEWSHRLVALVTSGLLVVTIVAAMRRPAGGPSRRVGGLLLLLLGVQIGLGAITVLFRLPHLVSTAHLINALLILAGLLLLAWQVTAGEAAAPAVPASLGRVARVGLVVLLLQLALGGYVRHTGAGLACPDFPLCSGDLLPGHGLAVAHWVHRWLGVLLLGLFAHLAILARRSGLRHLGWLVAGVAVLQVGLGIVAVLWRLAPPLRASHAAVGYLLWASLVWITIRAGAAGEPEPAARRRSAREMVHAG